MENIFFKMICQKAPDGKMVLVSVVDENFFGSGTPSIFELQAFKMPATIYTGTYPQLKINTDTIKDRTEELKGEGIAGILTSEQWYCVTKEEKDVLGISIR